jgi:phosphoglycolate phosphatase-like HAD superfamily hydrolase
MHVCFFDIDGTLLNSGGAGQAAMEAALLAEFGTSEEPHGISTAGRTDRGIVADLFRFYGVETGEEIYERFLEAYLTHLPAQLSAKEGIVLPGIAALLAALDAREDVLLGLLTGNYERGAKVKLKHFGLDHYFDFGGYGDRHTDRAGVAREALEAVRRHHPGDIDLGRTWVIGDTPHDVTCGRAIGAKVIAVCTGMFPREQLAAAAPDHLFDDFSDPRPMLELLTR